ncbi:gamma interferon inducible lysosomal thiol reductase [Thermoascus aurantiacus ATCC 26904]
MEEKTPAHPRPHHNYYDASAPATTAFTSRRDRCISRFLRRALTTICLCLAFYVLLNRYVRSAPPNTNDPNDGRDAGTDNSVPTGSSKKVPLEAHIMSKCPDARDCLQQLIVPAMELINDKVDFRLSFIGSVSNKTSEVECKHGPTECIGNMLILCASRLPFSPDTSSFPSSSSPASTSSYPRMPTVRWLGFANCLISSYEEIPQRSLVEYCALEHGIDFDALNQCASQQEDYEGFDGEGDTPLSGIALLRKSALRSQRLGVTTSCTVRLDESVWCVRDGGEWKDCVKNGEGSKVSVLVDEVERLWKERN